MSANVVIVGFGIGFNTMQYHFNTINSTEGLNLYGMCDTKHDRRLEAKIKYQIKTFNNFEKILDDDNVDLLVIATPNHTHAPMAIKALNAGKHVVTEKPMCLNVKEVDAMIRASEQSKCLLSVRQNRRWDTDFLTVKHMIDENLLGDIYSIDSAINMFVKPSSWRAKEETGGGFLRDWGSHILDQIVLFAKSEPERVYAIISSRLWDVNVDTHSRVLTTFRNGIITEIDTSNISRIGRPRWHIQGEKGALIYQNGKAWIKTDEGEREIPNITGNSREFYQNISSAINNEAELLVKPAEVRKSIAIIEAAFLSSKTGESVKLSF